MTRVVVVDDQELVRQGLRTILELGGVEVVGEAADGEAAVRAVVALRPDVVLMDLRMPGMDGVAATERIAALDSGARVLVLTTFDLDRHVVDALRAGASGFLLKDVTADGLLDAVARAASGEPVVSPVVLARMMEHFSARPPAVRLPAGLQDLSDREREILALIGAGRSNGEIAQELFISMATVKTHVRHIFGKLEVRDRAQAVVVARDAGLEPR